MPAGESMRRRAQGYLFSTATHQRRACRWLRPDAQGDGPGNGARGPIAWSGRDRGTEQRGIGGIRIGPAGDAELASSTPYTGAHAGPRPDASRRGREMGRDVFRSTEHRDLGIEPDAAYGLYASIP
jgi:hypothetical protein